MEWLRIDKKSHVNAYKNNFCDLCFYDGPFDFYYNNIDGIYKGKDINYNGYVVYCRKCKNKIYPDWLEQENFMNMIVQVIKEERFDKKG